MDSVATLDADRIISALREMIRATLRTNFYQSDEAGGPKPYISFKLDPRKMVVTGTFNVRGGLQTTVTATHEKG